MAYKNEDDNGVISCKFTTPKSKPLTPKSNSITSTSKYTYQGVRTTINL